MGEIHGGDEVFVYDEGREQRCNGCPERIRKGDRVVAWADDGDLESGPLGPFFEHEACAERARAEAERMAEAYEAYEIEHHYGGNREAYEAEQAQYERYLALPEREPF